MRNTSRLLLLLFCAAGFSIAVNAQPLALVYDKDSDVQLLMEVDPAGALTPVGDGISGCCSVSGALAARDTASLFFVGSATRDSRQTLQVIDANTGSSLQSGIDFPATLSILALRWDDLNDRLLVLTIETGTNSLQLNTLDPATGNLTAVGSPIADCCGIAVGVDVLDADDQLWYVTAIDIASGLWQLLTIDLTDGQLINPAVALSQPPVSLHAADAGLLALYYDSVLPGERLATLNTATGIYSPIGTGLVDCCLAAQGVATVVDDGLLQLARPDTAGPFAFFSIETTGGTFTQQLNVPANLVVNALFADINNPVIAEGAMTSVSIDEDNTPAAFGLTLNATDPKQGGLTWSIDEQALLGTASVATGTGLVQAINYLADTDNNGMDSFVVRVVDSEGDFDRITVNVLINPVNDAPGFTIGADQSALEDSGLQTVDNWITAISPGPANESAQTVQFVVSTDNPLLFDVQPVVTVDGNLTYTAAADNFGSATLMVQAVDNGGVDNGGINSSTIQSAVISITPVNDAPVFSVGADQTVLEDAGPQNVTAWATAIMAGPANESAQTVEFIVSPVSPSAFSQAPQIDPVTGNLTYTVADDVFGPQLVNVQLVDNGGMSNGGMNSSSIATLLIDITPVNDPPFIELQGDITVAAFEGPQVITDFVISANAGPDNESSQSVSFAITDVAAESLFSELPIIDDFGTLSFTPAGNVSGSTLVRLQATDDGGINNGGVDQQEQVFRISVVNRVADLVVDMTANRSFIPQHEILTLIATVTNDGPEDVEDALLDIPFSESLGSARWSCTASGTVCPAMVGNGSIAESIDLPVGSQLVFTVRIGVIAAEGTDLEYTASVLSPDLPVDVVQENNIATTLTTVGVLKDGFEDV